MGLKFETLGNAILQVFENDKPVLATDPWLRGTAYFGSWALDHALTEHQIQNVVSSPFVWISHGHPDHLHNESVQLLSKTQQILLPNHYHPEIADSFRGKGFSVSVMRFKEWMRLTPSIRAMCLENENQDGILIVEAGDALIINLNDSPLGGEGAFLKNLVRNYRKTFLLSLCSIDADMFNFVDDDGKSLVGPPDAMKRGEIQGVCDLCSYLGVQYFCCFSSQHVYVRGDSKWANPYRIGWHSMQEHWNSRTQLVEPFVTVDLSDCTITRNHPTQQTDMSRVSDTTGDDAWNEKMSEADWKELGEFVHRFKLLNTRMDFVQFTVAGERRTYYLNPRAEQKDPRNRRGVNFFVPRHSLMETVQYGYFDDLLIGNFMKTQVINFSLYPNFSPYIAKYGGNAKVYTAPELWKMRWHYFSLSPMAYLKHHLSQLWVWNLKPVLRAAFRTAGVLEASKAVGRRLQGLPPVP